MFIVVNYKVPPELSPQLSPQLSQCQGEDDEEPEVEVEKVLLVNPKCAVRNMLEYIRKQCKLAETTHFDLSDESGKLKQLFSYPSHTYATPFFEPKKAYYLVVLATPSSDFEGKFPTVLPQLSRTTHMYVDLQAKIRRAMAEGSRASVCKLAASSTIKRKLSHY